MPAATSEEGLGHAHGPIRATDMAAVAAADADIMTPDRAVVIVRARRADLVTWVSLALLQPLALWLGTQPPGKKDRKTMTGAVARASASLQLSAVDREATTATTAAVRQEKRLAPRTAMPRWPKQVLPVPLLLV